ncbi:hypothetical protein HYV12_01980 [Candidatus Dojkabacteria bacterium]|nr:hypothetical protein [Candidatus Dojkabacteria bacterium]
MKIGFIGQGWIGKNYADNFETRGFNIVRYGVEEEHSGNKEKIKECDIVLIAVPTPSTPDGFDDSIVREVVGLVGDGKIAVIKSTIVPGTTESIQKMYPKKFVFHSPEFLTEATARYDADNPDRNIIGIPVESDEYRRKAREVIEVLPKAPYELICAAKEAELIKYAGNVSFVFKVMFFNLLYDVAQKVGADYEVIKEGIGHDPRIGFVHTSPVHKTGRGAGGHCFIKDFKAFMDVYEEKVGGEKGMNVLKSLEDMNLELLISSNKDLDLLEGVYGKEILKK